MKKLNKYKGLIQPELYKTIPMTKGYYCKVDNEDFEELKKYNWCCAISNSGRVYAINSKLRQMHRFLIKCPKDKIVDHINGDSLDNRKENLRICTNQQNIFNSNKTKGKSKGYYFSKQKNKYVAEIMINRKKIYLGCYINPEDAAKAYDKKAIELFGEYANLNYSQTNIK